MNPHFANSFAQAANYFLKSLLALQLLLLLALTVPAESGPALHLSVAAPGISNEFSATARLEWSGVPDATYVVQGTTNLSDPGSWKDEDLAMAEIGPIKWMAPESLAERRFYRVVTSPAITDVQPTFVDASDTNAVLYILGQLLPTNASVVINGTSLAPVIVNSNGVWATVSLNGLPPGEPVIRSLAVVDNGTGGTVAALGVQSPLVYGTELTNEQLQGPPEEPPASPDALLGAWLSKRGYDYYKAQSDLNAAGRHSNPYFQENQTAGEMPQGRIGPGAIVGIAVGSVAGVAGPGFCGADDAGEARVVEGKKGINAVKVKLARMAFGSGSAAGIGGEVVAGIVVACLSSGELQAEETDLSVPGRGLDFAWTRTYRSRTGPSTAQGAGWDHSFNVSLTLNGDGTVVLRPGNGRADTFYPDGTNGWFRDEYFAAITDSDGNGLPDLLTFASGNTWVFEASAQNPKKVNLKTIKERDRSRIELMYDGSELLTGIVDDLDRTNTITYNASGLIESVTDFSGRAVRYEYDGNGDLVAVVTPGTPDFPDGITNRYTYSSGNVDDRLNHNLTSCVDGKGQTRLQVSYQPTNNPASIDFDAVSSLRRGIEKKDIKRGMVIVKPSSRYAAVKATVRDALGNVTESYYDSRQRCVALVEYTGRVSPDVPMDEMTLPPGGKLRSEDPDFYETQWTWNPDSLCTSETRPDGSRTEFVYQRAYNQNTARTNKTRQHEGNLRVLRERASAEGGDLDGDGAPDITELAWYFESDPRFGSPSPNYSKYQAKARSTEGKIASAADYGSKIKPFRGNSAHSTGFAAPGGLALRHKYKGWDGLIYGNHRVGKGWDGTIKDRPPEAGARIRGDGGYGDTVAARAPAGVTHEYHRFATSVTDPRGNVTTAEYDGDGNCVRMRKRPELLFQAWEEGYAYNAYGQLTAITNAPDANGQRRVDTLSYHASGPQAGYLASIAIDEPGVHLITAFEYDARGNVTRVVDPRGNDWLYTYNALDQCVERRGAVYIYSGGHPRIASQFYYDANGNIVRCDTDNCDESGAVNSANPHWTTLYEYDAQDRLSGVVQEIAEGGSAASYATNRFFYDADGQLAAIHFPPAVSGVDPHNTVAFEYDERGLLFRAIGAPGSSTTFTNEYSYTLRDGEFKELLEKIDKPISKHRVAYDGFGRPTRFTDAMSNVVACVYDRSGNLTLARWFGQTNDVPGDAGNRLLAETLYTYDGLDRCVQQVDSFFDVFTGLPIGDGASTTTITYASNGACTSVTDDNGHTTSYAYDTAGRCSQVTDPKNNLLQFTYDADDNLTGIVSIERPDSPGPEQRFSRSFSYDPLNRCVETVDNVGNTNRYAYDSRGNLVSHLSPREDETYRVYDGLNRCVATTNYVGKERGITINTSHVEYQTTRLVSATDSNGNTTQYAYDSLDRCVTITEADGTSCSLVWSPRSNLILRQDGNGTVISNSFDLLDRCVRRDITPAPGVAATTTFETFSYDGLSRCVAAGSDASLATFAFDSLGNCVGSTQDGLATASTFDGEGNCVSMVYPGGRVVSGVHNPLNELASVSSSAGGGLPPITLATYAYEGPGRLGKITSGNGVETRVLWNGKVNPGNGAGDYGWRQVSGVSHQKSVGGVVTVIDRRVLAYDRDQNKTLRAQTVPFYSGGPMETNVFGYDALNRLKDSLKSVLNTIRVYELDGNGNRQVVTENGVAQAYVMDAGNPPADYQMNQYTLTPYGGQTYDENGNLQARGATADAYTQYQYDYADRLVLVQSIDASSGTAVTNPVAAYAYDALGRRIARTTYPGGLPPVTTQFVYDGNDCDDDDPIEEREGGTLVRTYVIPHVLEQRPGGKRACFKASKITFGGGTTAYLHCDDLGNALALTDDSGAVLERYEYEDYGLPSFLNSDGGQLIGGDGLPVTSSPAGNSFLFRGMQWDAEAGFYFDHSQGSTTGPVDPLTGRAVRGKVKSIKDMGNSGFAGANPWSLKKEEGGRHTPFHNRRTYNYFEAWPCRWQAPELNSRVSLIVPVAMDKGLRFAVLPRNILKSYFETGDVPTQDDFYALPDRDGPGGGGRAKSDTYVWKLTERPRGGGGGSGGGGAGGTW